MTMTMKMTTTALPNPADAPAATHPLRDSRFRLFWAGSSISLLGDQFYLVALPWVVFQLTGSAVAIAGILMAAAIPRAVLMLMGGAASDRISARKIMMATAAARAVLVGAIAALLGLHRLRIWELYFLGFGFGAADAFAFPAAQTYLPFLVPRERLLAANSVFQTTAQLVTIVGPAPAGIAVKAFGTAWAFLIDALSFVFIPAALCTLPDPPRAPAADAKQSVWHSILEGIRYVRADVPLRSLILTATVINFCIAGPVAVGLPYLAATKFGSPTAYATLVSCVAAGGLLGALLAGVWKPRRRGTLILLVCAILGLCLGSIGVLPRIWMIGAMLLVMGVAAGVVNIHIASWCQQRVEPAIRGRVMSVLMFAAMGLLPFSLAVAGGLSQWNIKLMFILAGAGTFTVTCASALHRSVREIE
jgi:MFS family permease